MISVEVIDVIRWKQRNLTSNKCNLSFPCDKVLKYDKDQNITTARVKKHETKLIELPVLKLETASV